MKSFGSKRAGDRPRAGAKTVPATTAAEAPVEASPGKPPAQKGSSRQASSRPASRAASPATIRDVAKAAGVSPMTISNFLNERIGTMRPETRGRIAAEIERLGYRPHSMARGLRLAKQLS